MDAGPEPDAGPDARVPEIIRDPLADRDVPPELKNESCAVEVDKVYALTEIEHQPDPTRLSADVVGSRFTVGYVGPSPTCIETLFLAQLQGGSGEPTTAPALDNCTQIQHATVAHNGEAWLLGSVEARMGPPDLWVQTYASSAGTGHRVSESDAEETDVALAMSSGGVLLAAWAELDLRANTSRLLARSLRGDGTPDHDIVVLEEATGVTFGSLSLSAVGSHMALAYRRSETGGGSRIVLDVLDPDTGARQRDAWTLTELAGPFGTAHVAGDEEGGGVVYGVVDGGRRELWFQTLGVDGAAAPVQSAGQLGGPSGPTRPVGPPYRAIDASVVKVPAGYALAYRALPGGVVTSPQIRVHFLDRFGREGGVSSVALANETGGRTGIATGYDGRMVIAWNDSSEDGKTRLTAVRVPCVAP